MAFRFCAVVILASACLPILGQENLDSVRKLEAAGETAAARIALVRATQTNPNSATAWRAYAEFMDRSGDPGAREAYARLLAILTSGTGKAGAAAVARRLALLDLLAGDRPAAAAHLATNRELGGRPAALGAAAAAPPASAQDTATIAGPLRSFARMAALPVDAEPAAILPALARNIVTNGYQASHNNESLEQTEYLKLVHRYMAQARELEKLSGESRILTVSTCDSPAAGELLRILGFRMRGGCGSEVVLETVNAPRAFVTTDSGFPINDLEQALRTNRPFIYDYHPTVVPVLFGTEYWLGSKDRGKDTSNFVESFISDPSICRLYVGFSKLDPPAAEGLKKVASLTRLKAYAHVLDFFGGMFELRDGKAVVPGGARSAAAWGELAGASPDSGAAFFDKLMAKDDGWLASLYDALARIQGPVQAYLTDPSRMKRFYSAVRGRVTSPGPARPVFRANTDMMLFTTRMRIDAGGKPHIPGNLEVWRNLFLNHPQGKYDSKLTKLAAGWKEPDDVLEALFALSRKAVENEPLKIFMAIGDIDRNRATPLTAPTVDRLAREYHTYGSQYPLFSESRSLSEKTMLEFLDQAAAIGKVKDPSFHADLAGTFQALAGLWQILVRQQSIPEAQADDVLSGIISGFAQVAGSRDLFDAGRNGVKVLLGPAAEPNSRLLEMLAGSTTDSETHDQMVEDLMRILDAQRTVSLDTLFQVADHIDAIAKGGKPDAKAINKLASQIGQIQLPHAALSSDEKNTLSFGYWPDRHIESERKLNLRAAIEKAAGDATKLRDVRGLLVPFLRDTLLTFNYAHYAPPGAQILYTNPVFVRSHDFIGMQGADHTWHPTEVYGTGWPSNGGGRLVGSLSSLPYVLAEAEQNFLVPTQTQALIWGDLVPQMILGAKIPRFWQVTPAQMRWLALHLRYGRELLAEAALDGELRGQVVETLATLAAPVRTRQVAQLLEHGAPSEAAERVTPAELYLIAREAGPRRDPQSSCILAELQRMASAEPALNNHAAISRAFGTPKPALSTSYQPELLNLRTFPTLMGYSSRIMAESWESNTLYWAALADELSISPSQLNVRIPEWTRKLVEQIFASHLEDWPAVLRSLHQVGDEERARSRALATEQRAAALQE